MEGALIGIDLGSKFVKVCKVVNDGKKSSLSILCAMTMSSPDSALQKMALMSLLKKLKLNSDASFLAVGGQSLINRDLLLSKKIDKKNLKNVVKLEVEQSINEDLDKMFSSFTITKDISEDEYNVLFSAVPRENIYSKVNVIKNVQNLKLAGVTMESLALVNAFNMFGPSYKNTESIILVNIGHTNTNITVLNNKELIFMRDVGFGGKDVTNDIANLYTIPEKLAEEIKRRTDLWDDIGFNVKNVLKKSTATLLEAIFRTIEHCITRQYIVAVDRVVITGGGSMLEGIDNFIGDTLGIATNKWNPLIDNNVTGYVNQNYGCFMPVSLGLAIEKEFDNVQN
jgi:type IV pilus assembly protein PilM